MKIESNNASGLLFINGVKHANITSFKIEYEHPLASEIDVTEDVITKFKSFNQSCHLNKTYATS